MGLTKDSLREDQITGALSGLLYAYEVIGIFLKKFTNIRGGVWISSSEEYSNAG